MAGSRFKGIGEREGEGMAEAFFVKAEEAFSRDPQMAPLFRGGIDLRRGQVAAVDQIMDGASGNGEELGDIANFDQRRDGLFWKDGTICNHSVEFMGLLRRL
jgi:hypothetical protein